MTPDETRIRPVKRLGQNFLRDEHVARTIVATGEISRGETVLEPGAGYGSLTRLLARHAGRVIAVEKDRRLADGLRSLFHDAPNVSVLEGDVLRLDLPEFDKIVGTPPYYISSKLVLLMLKKNFLLASLVFQEEFGLRLTARRGTSDYGRLSVMAQHGLTVEMIRRIPRTVFSPVPKVDSALLRIRKKPASNENAELYGWIVRELFTQRRRLVRGAMRHALEKGLDRKAAERIVSNLSIPGSRVFQLSPEDFQAMSGELSEALSREGISARKLLVESSR